MQKLSRRCLMGAGLALALAAAGPAAAQTKWNLPGAYGPANFHTQNLVQFAEDVRKATNGALDITVHGNASLFKATEIKRAVQTGQAQAGEVLISLHENEDPVFGLDVVPFLATSFADARKLWQAQKPAVEKRLAGQGLMVLYGVGWPPQGIYAKKEVNTLEDLRGSKWRAYNVGTSRIGEIVGAQAVTVQAAELPQALATGVVNAFMTSGSTGVDSKVWETMTHYYDTQAWIPKNVVFVNKAAFDALPAAQKEAVTKAAAAAEERGWTMAEAATQSSLATLKERGMKVLEPSPALKDGLKKIGDQLTQDWVKRAGADGQAIVDAFRKM